MKPYIASVNRVVESEHLVRIDTTWSTGALDHRYEHLEPEPINADGTAYNGRRAPIIIAGVGCVVIVIAGLVEAFKAIF